MKSFFVTGTDTGIGKTMVTSAMCAYLSLDRGMDVGVMKPFESGLGLYGKDALPCDAIALREASGSQDDLFLINPYSFDNPVAPETAAEL
jgi:dethiobiotin synthetase